MRYYAEKYGPVRDVYLPRDYYTQCVHPQQSCSWRQLHEMLVVLVVLVVMSAEQWHQLFAVQPTRGNWRAAHGHTECHSLAGCTHTHVCCCIFGHSIHMSLTSFAMLQTVCVIAHQPTSPAASLMATQAAAWAWLCRVP